MQIDYERTVDDLIQFNLFHTDHSPTIQRQLLWWRGLTALLVILLPLGPSYLMTQEPSPIAYIIGILGGVVAFFVFPPISRTSNINQWKKIIAEGNNKAILGRHILTLSEAGIHAKSPGSESDLEWSTIQKVLQSKSHIFLYISAVNALVIPKKAFPTEQSQQSFLDFVLSKTKTGEVSR